MLESSFGSKNQGVILGNLSFQDSNAKILKIKSVNSKKMGDLCAQLKDPKRSIEVLGALGKDFPFFNYKLLSKGLDFGMKLWNKK